MPTRDAILQHVADALLALRADQIVRVAIDGVDGAGKTTFADELAPRVLAGGRPVIRASVDGFHNPRAIRYARGPASPEGFFLDSYDYGALRTRLLDPLAPSGSGCFRRAVFDHCTDSPVEAPPEQALPGAILILDGIFLHRDELYQLWDYSIFLEVGFQVSIPRGAQRGTGSPNLADPANRRYIEGQMLYLATCAPQRRATVMINNENLTAPTLRGGSPAPPTAV